MNHNHHQDVSPMKDEFLVFLQFHDAYSMSLAIRDAAYVPIIPLCLPGTPALEVLQHSPLRSPAAPRSCSYVTFESFLVKVVCNLLALRFCSK